MVSHPWPAPKCFPSTNTVVPVKSSGSCLTPNLTRLVSNSWCFCKRRITIYNTFLILSKSQKLKDILPLFLRPIIAVSPVDDNKLHQEANTAHWHSNVAPQMNCRIAVESTICKYTTTKPYSKSCCYLVPQFRHAELPYSKILITNIAMFHSLSHNLRRRL